MQMYAPLDIFYGKKTVCHFHHVHAAITMTRKEMTEINTCTMSLSH